MAPEDGSAGASISGEALSLEPHAHLAALRATAPIAWVQALEAWVVTTRELCIEVLGDAATFTVDDDRFSTRQVVGPAMLSLDGAEHRRHRSPFAPAFRSREVRANLEGWIAGEARSVVDGFRDLGSGDLRALLAAPLAAAVMRKALALDDVSLSQLSQWNDLITAAIDEVTIGRPTPDHGERAFDELRAAVARSMRGDTRLLSRVAEEGSLSLDEVAANVAVLLIGGVVTSEGTIAITLYHLLTNPQAMERVQADPTLIGKTIDESMRLEPAAAFVDRYAAKDVDLAGASIQKGDLVRVSIMAANRDPETFDCPDEFDIDRPNSGDHISFARGPHACLGIHVARVETRLAIEAVLGGLPGLALAGRARDPEGLIFRAPPTVPTTWSGESLATS